MKVGIVGLGYWGPNLVRNFIAQKNVEKVIACDQRTDRLDFIKAKSPSVLVSFYQNQITLRFGERQL